MRTGPSHTHIPCHRHPRYVHGLECKDTPEVERTANHSLLVRDASTASTEGISRQIVKERHRLRRGDPLIARLRDEHAAKVMEKAKRPGSLWNPGLCWRELGGCVRLSVNDSLTRLHLILMSEAIRAPLRSGDIKLGCDQARAAAKRHRSCRTHERTSTHDGLAVGGVEAGYHDASFEMG